MRFLLLALLCAVAAADTVVLRDQNIVEGSASRSDKALTVEGKSYPLGDVLLWETKGGEAKYTGSYADQLQAYIALARRDIVVACRKSFDEAVQAGARRSAEQILCDAGRAGLPPKEAADWDKKIEQMSAKEGAEVASPADAALARLLAKRAQVALDAEDDLGGWRLLRDALRRAPEDKEALTILEDIAPEYWKLGHLPADDPDPYKVQRLWLDWQVDVLQGEVRPLGRLHPDMERARNLWRKDLNGVETREEGAEIVFITPLNRPTAIIGKCVRYAKITCRALAKMFQTPKPKRDDNIPLVIYFYENKNEYVNYAGSPNPFLAMTAGFYTPGENVSRFFWPEGGSATRSVRDTFVHELTHHWIERRNPRWHASELAGTGERVQVPGYWVVEGFATFIEEGRYDIENYTWSHFAPKASSIDIVAALSKDGKLIDWTKEYTLTQAEFHGDQLDKKSVFTIAKKRWAMRPQPLVEIRLFYEQAAATCHFLYWGEGGKYRAQLLDYVTAYYTSQKDKTGIDGAFGLTPAQLGKKVEEWCKKVIDDGWRPS